MSILTPLAVALFLALPEAPEDLAARAAAIKPAPHELKFQKIPWVTNLGRGQEIAKKENRPIFLWVTGDDPLERC